MPSATMARVCRVPPQMVEGTPRSIASDRRPHLNLEAIALVRFCERSLL